MNKNMSRQIAIEFISSDKIMKFSVDSLHETIQISSKDMNRLYEWLKDDEISVSLNSENKQIILFKSSLLKAEIING
ncbi:hypothetical protein [Clostridium chromiireducens]|uniref:Uncharacterized protein n=1 Tax=Clostridium chromiireducens TaxID=225345 RepID=A0A1V4IS83_9CLOT|nr:hypothetical protein [Clostridium chromiireducens]MVX64881.1 hypothetical protein [Clostridium chromiireducens]OPJ62654.1 hypothetical protein CLCHR_19470 [Clostridium chromiireducens]RII33275.1 hypothetical protein D2A34_16115 [Clostridium chromiireducens]